MDNAQGYKYAVGTMYAGTDTRFHDYQEALDYFKGFLAKEMYDKDDSVILCEIQEDEITGYEEIVIDSWQPQNK